MGAQASEWQGGALVIERRNEPITVVLSSGPHCANAAPCVGCAASGVVRWVTPGTQWVERRRGDRTAVTALLLLPVWYRRLLTARKLDENGQSCPSPCQGMCGQTVGRHVGETLQWNRDRLGHQRSPNPPLNSSDLCGVVWWLNVQSGQCKRSVSLHQEGGGPATASIATGQSQH